MELAANLDPRRDVNVIDHDLRGRVRGDEGTKIAGNRVNQRHQSVDAATFNVDDEGSEILRRHGTSSATAGEMQAGGEPRL